jgi:hypothetical protein
MCVHVRVCLRVSGVYARACAHVCVRIHACVPFRGMALGHPQGGGDVGWLARLQILCACALSQTAAGLLIGKRRARPPPCCLFISSGPRFAPCPGENSGGYDPGPGRRRMTGSCSLFAGACLCTRSSRCGRTASQRGWRSARRRWGSGRPPAERRHRHRHRGRRRRLLRAPGWMHAGREESGSRQTCAHRRGWTLRRTRNGVRCRRVGGRAATAKPDAATTWQCFT